MVKYKLTKNAYLTVVGGVGGYHYNRHFDKGTVFENEGKLGDYFSLITPDFRVFVHKDRLKNDFELIWGDTTVFKDSPYLTEADDGD